MSSLHQLMYKSSMENRLYYFISCMKMKNSSDQLEDIELDSIPQASIDQLKVTHDRCPTYQIWSIIFGLMVITFMLMLPVIYVIIFN